MGAVALVACMVVGGFDLTSAAVIASGIFLVAGVIMGLPKEPLPGPGETRVVTPVIGGVVPVEKAHGAAPQAFAPAPQAAVTADIAPEPSGVVAAAAPATAFAAMAAEPASSGPARLSAPRGGVADDLKEIEGIEPSLETLCNGLGFYHFDQIAHWSDADVSWVDERMTGFKGRIRRDRWIPQAKMILADGLEAFRVRDRANDY